MKNGLRRLPLLPLRGMMVFPYMMVHLDAGREQSVAALEQAMLDDKVIMLTAQKDADIEKPGFEDLYSVGTVAEIKHLVKMPGGTVRVLVEGLYRAQIVNCYDDGEFIDVDVHEYEDVTEQSLEMEALVRVVVHEFEQGKDIP